MRTSILNSSISFLFKLPKRGYRFARRMFFAGLHRLCARAFVIPYLRYRGVLSKCFLMKVAFDSIAIFDHKVFYKVALKRSTIELEYRNFSYIRRYYPVLLKILPDYAIKKSAFVTYLSMACYKPVGVEASLVYASSIYELMRVCGSREQTLEISNSVELRAGLKVIQDVYGESISRSIYQIVDSYLADGYYHVGFAHGDFHSRNILVDDNGEPRLIDLDCVRLHGIQELDAMCFVLEMEWSKSGKPWYETIASYLKGDIPNQARVVLDRFGIEYSLGLGVSYLVDRIGQETKNYGFEYTDAQLYKAIKEILAIPLGILQPSQTR